MNWEGSAAKESGSNVPINRTDSHHNFSMDPGRLVNIKTDNQTPRPICCHYFECLTNIKNNFRSVSMKIKGQLANTLQKALQQFTAVLVNGPGQAGKTTFLQNEAGGIRHHRTAETIFPPIIG